MASCSRISVPGWTIIRVPFCTSATSVSLCRLRPMIFLPAPMPRDNSGTSRLTKIVVEGALEGALDDHLGYGKNDPSSATAVISGNGHKAQTSGSR